ncbi:MAG: 30S ribosomal protein S6 [Ruminococcaceae bacterium]|nr:30S ribosomal protein S6 [Oscillospiraceae bacterium]
MTSKYETIFVVSAELEEEAVNTLITKFKDMISANGTVEKVEDWGKRKLAYPIDDVTDGYYTLVNYSAAHDFPAELERVFNITDGILRSLTVKVEE